MTISSAVERWRWMAEEFGRLSSRDIQRWLDLAALQLDATAYGDNIEVAQVLLGAHMLKLSRLEAAAKKPLVKASAQPGEDLVLTTYGQQLLRLRTSASAATGSPMLLSLATL